MALRIDTSELHELEADFREGPGRAQRGAPRVLAASARRVEAGMKGDAAGHRYLDEMPDAVDKDRVGPLEWEVGFNHGGQGSLAHIIVFGSINNGPVFDHTDSLRRDIPLLERDAADAAETWALGRGGGGRR